MSIQAKTGIAVGVVVAVALVVRFGLGSVHIQATRAGGEKALDRLSDWAKWMAGIQTATLAALGLTLKDHTTAGRDFPAIGTVVFMGAALFCSAWVLSSIPNVSLALTAPVNEGTPLTADGQSTAFDVYERPLYAGLARKPGGKWLGKLTLNYMVTLQHWLWALGLLSFAAFLLTATT